MMEAVVDSLSSTLKSTDFLAVTLGTFLVHEMVFMLANVPYLLMDDFKIFQQYKLYEVSLFFFLSPFFSLY